MSEITLICGKICSGKTTYARVLQRQNNAVILSSDEAVLKLFGMYLGEEHERITNHVEQYLKELAIQILQAGTNVILDWGFWTAQDREETTAFFREQGFTPKWHCVETTEEQTLRNIRTRNAAVERGDETAFFVDPNLAEKCEELFERPHRLDMDVWYVYA